MRHEAEREMAADAPVLPQEEDGRLIDPAVIDGLAAEDEARERRPAGGSGGGGGA